MELPNNKIKISCGGKNFYERRQKILVFLFFRARVSCSVGWPKTQYVRADLNP